MKKEVYQDYYEYSEQIGRSASNRILALNRGEKEKILKVDIDIDRKKRRNHNKLYFEYF